MLVCSMKVLQILVICSLTFLATAQISEVKATLQDRDDHISELSTSLRNIVSLGSNCSQKVQSLQQKVDTMTSNFQSALHTCKLAGKNLELTRLETGWYYFSNQVMFNWFQAQKFCNLNGLQLTSIESEKENNALVRKVNELGIADYSHYWISGTDWAETGRWYWASSGQDFVYTAWHDTQPDNFNDVQRCASLWRTGSVIAWDDEDCNFNNSFICEMPQFCHNLV